MRKVIARPVCLARHAPSPHTPLARYFYVLTQRALSRSSCAHSCTARLEKYSPTTSLRQRSRSTHPIDRGRGRRRVPEWPGWSRAHARSHGHGGPAAAAAAAPRGGRWWRPGVRERGAGQSAADPSPTWHGPAAWSRRRLAAPVWWRVVASSRLSRYARDSCCISVRIAMFGCPDVIV